MHSIKGQVQQTKIEIEFQQVVIGCRPTLYRGGSAQTALAATLIDEAERTLGYNWAEEIRAGESRLDRLSQDEARSLIVRPGVDLGSYEFIVAKGR